MGKQILDFLIVENRQIKRDFFVLTLKSPARLPVILPGQFVQILVKDSQETFLRRPFSIHDVDFKEDTIRILVQVVGKGTRKLSCMTSGGTLNLILPLGNSFSFPGTDDKIILIGGGCGIAPLLFLARYLKSHGYRFDILMGFRSSDRIIEHEEYSELAEVFVTTEDGSEGEKGFVTQHSVLERNSYTRAYCCGPDPMMKAVAAYCRPRNIACEVSLENLMACGIGICLCCVVTTTRGNVTSCVEGPVFNINELKW
jgi:dihydroorotate dehydrogenase electron transfer subunit